MENLDRTLKPIAISYKITVKIDHGFDFTVEHLNQTNAKKLHKALKDNFDPDNVKVERDLFYTKIESSLADFSQKETLISGKPLDQEREMQKCNSGHESPKELWHPICPVCETITLERLLKVETEMERLGKVVLSAARITNAGPFDDYRMDALNKYLKESHAEYKKNFIDMAKG